MNRFNVTPPAFIVMYAKDVARVIGKSERTARELMKDIRKVLGKDRHHLISLGEFCKYTGLPEEEVLRRLADHKH